MKESFTASPESKELKKVLFENMQKAQDACMVIYGRMMTGDMSVQKAQRILDETFIDSGLITEIDNSNVSVELKTRIKQVLADPYLIPTLANTYDLARGSLENIFAGGLGLIEGESLDFEIESFEDRKKISDILHTVGDITHNEVIDITYKNYFLGRCPGSTGVIISKIGSEWKQIDIADGNLKVNENEKEKHFSAGDVKQIQMHGEMLVRNIKQTVLDIKLFLGERSQALPEKVCEILNDLLEELKKMISQSLDETQPSVVDYTGSSFEGRFAYTGIVEKEFRYRNLLREKLLHA